MMHDDITHHRPPQNASLPPLPPPFPQNCTATPQRHVSTRNKLARSKQVSSEMEKLVRCMKVEEACLRRFRPENKKKNAKMAAEGSAERGREMFRQGGEKSKSIRRVSIGEKNSALVPYIGPDTIRCDNQTIRTNYAHGKQATYIT